MGAYADMWTYRDAIDVGETGLNVVGYGVETIDGSIGKVEETTYEGHGSYIVVDTGPWIFGKKVMLPAGVIRDVDDTEEKVFVHRTKDEIKKAPEFDDTLVPGEDYRARLGNYYSP